MMAMSETTPSSRPVGVAVAAVRIVLSIVLAHAGLIAFSRLLIVVKVLAGTGLLWGPPHWQTTGRMAGFTLIVLACVAAIAWLRPWKALAAISTPPGGDDDPPQRIEAASFVLGNLLLLGIASTIAILVVVLFKERGPAPLNPLTFVFMGLNLLVAGAGLWGFRRLKPWIERERLSPSTRRTNALFGLSGLVCMPGVLVLAFASSSAETPFGLFSNGPVAPWVALLALASWALGIWLSWKWYFSADEHEREAYDFGSVVGAGIFTALAPAWWVAARTGLVAHPDPMVLWLITMFAIGVAWIWRRSR